MSRIEKTFNKLKAGRKKALIVYVMAGDPDLAATERLVPELGKAGADLIELGVPFSDPIADGPVIQRADERALRQKTTLTAILAMVARVRERTDTPLILMTYENPVCKYGEARFAEDAVKAGVDGVIVPDLPMEEAGPLHAQCKKHGLDLIFLAAPTSPPARLKKIAELSRGFIYYVSRTGVTGEQDSLSETLGPMVRKIRSYTDKPVAVGFGISKPEQSAAVGAIADAVVVGSAIVRRIGEKGGDPDLVPQIGSFVKSLVAPLRSQARRHG